MSASKRGLVMVVGLYCVLGVLANPPQLRPHLLAPRHARQDYRRNPPQP